MSTAVIICFIQCNNPQQHCLNLGHVQENLRIVKVHGDPGHPVVRDPVEGRNVLGIEFIERGPEGIKAPGENFP